MGKTIRIRKGIIESDRLNSTQIRVYQVLDAAKDRDGTALSYSQIARRAVISHSSAIRVCRELRQIGLIKWEPILQEDGDIDYCLYEVKDYRDWCDDNGIDEIKGFKDIDEDIITSDRISPNELRFIEALLFLDADKHPVRFTVREIVPRCSMSLGTVKNTLKSLIEKALVAKCCACTYVLQEGIKWKKG